MSAQIDIDYRRLNIVHVSCENKNERRRSRINGDKYGVKQTAKILKDIDMSLCGEYKNELKINYGLCGVQGKTHLRGILSSSIF